MVGFFGREKSNDKKKLSDEEDISDVLLLATVDEAGDTVNPYDARFEVYSKNVKSERRSAAQCMLMPEDDEVTINPYIERSARTERCIAAQYVLMAEDDEVTVNPCTEREARPECYGTAQYMPMAEDDEPTVNPYTEREARPECYGTAQYMPMAEDDEPTVNPYTEREARPECYGTAQYMPMAEDDEPTVNPYTEREASSERYGTAQYMPMADDDKATVNLYTKQGTRLERRSAAQHKPIAEVMEESTVNPYHTQAVPIAVSRKDTDMEDEESTIRAYKTAVSGKAMLVSLMIEENDQIRRVGLRIGQGAHGKTANAFIGADPDCKVCFDREDMPERVAELSRYGDILYVTGTQVQGELTQLNGKSLGIRPFQIAEGDILSWKDIVIQVEAIGNQ